MNGHLDWGYDCGFPRGLLGLGLSLFGRLLCESAPLQFGPGSPGCFLPPAGVDSQFLVADLGVRGLLPGVVLGLCGEPQLAGYVGLSVVLGVVAVDDPSLKFTMGHAACDLGLIAYLHSPDRGPAHVVEFGVAAAA